MTNTNADSANDIARPDLAAAHHEAIMLWGLTRALNTAIDAQEKDGMFALAELIEKQSRALADRLEALERPKRQKTANLPAAA